MASVEELLNILAGGQYTDHSSQSGSGSASGAGMTGSSSAQQFLDQLAGGHYDDHGETAIRQEQLQTRPAQLQKIEQENKRKQQEEKRDALIKEYQKLRGNSIPVTQKRNQLRAQLQELNRQMGLEEQDFSFSDRSASVFTGSTKQFGSGFLNFLGTGLDALRQLGQRLGGNTSPYAGYATDELSAAQIGTEQDPSYYDDAARMTERLQSAADRLSESGAEDLTRAKGGLGQLGQLGVDVASNALQMGYDAALGALSGGGSLASMFVRSAGSGMQSARQEGASTGQQLAFGAVSGGIEVLTEKMFDGVARIYGAGAADEIVEKAIGKLSKSDLGRSAMRWLTGAAGEGFEEVVSDLLAPYAETVYNGKSVGQTVKETFSEDGKVYDPSELLHDFIIGAALGGLGGAGSIATGQDAAANARLRTADTAREELLTRGFDKKTAQEMAGIIAKERSGEQLTQAEQTRLNRFPTAQEVLRQMEEQEQAGESGSTGDIQSSIRQTFEGAGIALHQAELTALANGYAAGETDADSYTQGALAAYRLGQSGQFTLEEAVRGSSWSSVLSESQFRNAFNLGAALRGNQTAAESSEDREQLKASLAKLGDYAGTAEEAYEAGQDASEYAAAMDKAASLYAANGADLRAVVQEARDGTRQDIVGQLTDRQVETAIQIGEQMRQQNRETVQQLDASYKQIREQAGALRGGQSADLEKINASIREANDTGKRALEAFNGQLADLERMAQAEPGAEESEEYNRLYDEALKNKETVLEMQEAIRELSEQKKELENRKPEARKGTLRLAEKAGEIGGVSYQAVDMGGLNEQQRAAVEAAEMIAQVTGLDITLISAKGNLGGAYLGGGQIYLNIRSGMGLKNFNKAIAAGSLAHEMTHWMKEYAPEEYAALREHTIGSMSAGQLDSLVQEQLRAEPGLSYDRAVDEVVANACQPLLRDSEAIERLARENMTLAERIVEFIRQFTEKIKAAFRQVDFHDNLPIYRAAQAVEQELDSMGRLWDRALTAARENQEAQRTVRQSEEQEGGAAAGSGTELQINESFANEIQEWDDGGRSSGETFILGSTGSVLQGLGAIESDIYMKGDKIAQILQKHPEMTLEEIKKIPQMLEDPVLIIKSRNTGRSRQNTRLLIFGSVRAQDGRPVMSVLDLRPVEKGLVISDMQRVTSAYTKDTNPTGFIRQSEILHADKKRTIPLLRTIGFHMPIELQQSGSIGSISYHQQIVNISGAKFSDVVKESGTQFQYIGENAAEADTDALERAGEMEKQGENRESIRRSTGWFRGRDGKWRREISDAGMKYDRTGDRRGAESKKRYNREYTRAFQELVGAGITEEQRLDLVQYMRDRESDTWNDGTEAAYKRLSKDLGERFEKFSEALEGRNEYRNAPDEGGTLEDYITHDELFRNYPELRSVELRFVKMPDGTRGNYDRQNNRININESLRGAPEATLLHEIQHAIQDIEGFSGGASPEYWTSAREAAFRPEARQRIERAQEQVNAAEEAFHREWSRDEINLNLARRYEELLDMWSKAENPPSRVTAEMEEIEQAAEAGGWDELLSDYAAAMAELNLARAQAMRTRIPPITAYQNTAGEIEARDTAKRRNLTDEQRRETPPDLGDENTVFAGEDSAMGWSKEYDPETASIKEQIEANKARLNAMKIVASAKVPTNLKSKEDAVKWAIPFLERTGYRVDRQGFGYISYDKAGIDQGMRYADTPAEKAAIVVLPKVLKRGIEIGKHDDHKARSKKTITFAAPVELNGIRGNMAVVVNRHGNKYYAHRIVLPDGSVFTFPENDNTARELSQGVTVSGSLARTTSAVSENNVAQSEEDVKGDFQRWDDTEDDTEAEKQGRELAYARLRSENALLKETVAALNKTVAKKEGTIGKLQSRLQLTKTPEVRQGDARRLARELLRQNSSRADAESVAGKIKAVGDYILQTEKVDEETLKAKARRAAVEILDAAYEDINIDSEIYGQIAGEIRGKKLSIDEDFLGELDSEGGYDKFRKSLFGSVTLAKRGSHTLEGREGYSSVDRFYTDMQGSFGKAYFPDVSNEGEQIKVLSELLKAGSPIEVNPFEKYMGEATEDLANRIAMEAMSGVLRPTAPTAADRQRARTQALRDQILELKKENKLEQREAARLYQTVYELSLALDKAESRYTSLGQEARYREAQVRAEGRERAAQIKAAERERAARQISALKFHYQEMERRARKNREENAGIRKYREQVEKKAKSLYELLTKNTNDKHVPQSLKAPLAQFLETLDFSGERLLSGGEATQKDLEMGARLQKLQQMLANQQRAINGEDAAPDDLGGYIDVSPGVLDYLREMSEKITEAMNTGRSFTINLMSAEDLKKLSILLSNLGAAIRNMNKFMANARYASVQEAASDDIADMEELGKVSALGNSGVSKFTMWENGVPYYVFKRFGKGGESIFEGFTKGWERMAFNAKEIIDFTEKTYSAKEVRAWKKEGHDFTLSDGSKIHMTTGQIMELSQLLGREQAVQHMEKGGVRIGSIRTKKGELADPTHYHLSQEDLAQIVGTLTDRQFEVARQMQRFMARKGADWGNEVSMRRFGYNFYEEGPGYYPIRTDSNDRPMADTDAQQNSMFRLLNLSSSKAVNPRATNALIVGDIFDTFADHMSDMAKLNGMGLPILDAIKWFSYKERVDRPDGTYDTRTVQGAMERAYGGQALRYFRTLMKDINGQTETGDRGTGLSGWFLSHYKAAAVGANLRVAALQPTSYVRALTVLKPQHLAKGLLRNNYEEAMKWSGTAVWKSLGYYDTDISKSMRGQIQHADSWREKAVEFSMILAEKGDSLTWGRLWTACRSQAKAENRNLSGEALMEATAGLFREVIYSSQVMDATLTRSEVMRAKGGLSKLRSAFMAEPTLSYNILMDSVNEFFRETRRSGSKAKAWQKINKKFARATMTYLSSAALAAVVESLADAIRDDDDDKFLNKWLEAFWGETWYDGNFKQDLTILGKLPEVKDIQALLTGSDSGNMSWSAIQGAVEVYQMVVETVKLEKGEIDRATKVTSYGRITPWGMIYKGLQAFSQLTALPFANMSRDVLALYNTVMGAMGYDDKKVRRYDAGDESRIQDAFEAGRLTEEEAIARLIEKGEADDEEDAYWTVRGWATGYGKYDGLKEAALSGDSGAYKSAMEELTGHGVKEKEALSEMKKFLKKAYTGGELSKAEASILGEQSLDAAKAQQILTGLAGMKQEEAKELTAAWAFQKEHGFSYEDGKKEAYLEGSVSRQEMKGYLTGYGGMSAEDAEEQLDAWDFEEEHGYAYGSRKEAFLSGQISRQEAINVMTGYGGMSREDAEIKVQVWEWSRDVPGAEDITEAAVRDYNANLAGSGVSKETYVGIWKQKNATKADLDENGESIRNSVTAKVIPMIDALPISAEQKTAIALCWWAESTVNKYKLW